MSQSPQDPELENRGYQPKIENASMKKVEGGYQPIVNQEGKPNPPPKRR